MESRGGYGSECGSKKIQDPALALLRPFDRGVIRVGLAADFQLRLLSVPLTPYALRFTFYGFMYAHPCSCNSIRRTMAGIVRST